MLRVKKAFMDFIQPTEQGEFFRKKYEISYEEELKVKEQLRATYECIQNYEFEHGCQKDDCYWCNFVKYHFDASKLDEEDLYIYD